MPIRTDSRIRWIYTPFGFRNVQVIADLFADGESMADIAHGYRVPRVTIEDAIRSALLQRMRGCGEQEGNNDG